MGFAVVDVNMRGTGCSGGAFDYFEPLQNLDAYDVIETIAHQPWVLHHKVGMFGVSYGGISQLFAAQLRPPALEAIAPLSVVDATATTLYSGGILNTGFAVPWAEERQFDAEPAGPSSGEHWAYEQIQNGDQTCAANQDLHEEATNLLSEVKENATYNPPVADPLDPVTFVHNIDVPTFMACQWEDEQTGGHCADLAEHFTGTEHKWFTFTNGAHIDSLDPYTFDRLDDFLELYVAHQAPINNTGDPACPGADRLSERASDSRRETTSRCRRTRSRKSATYAEALSAFTALPEVRVLFDNGAGTSPSGGTTAAATPIPDSNSPSRRSRSPARSLARGTSGRKAHSTEEPATSDGVDSYTSDAGATPLTDYTGSAGPGGLWGNASQWEWNWVQPPAGSAVSYVSAPLSSDTTAIGGGAVNLWVKSSTPDVDLQATISEVRPDGNETFVQNGWIRASERKLATTSDKHVRGDAHAGRHRSRPSLPPICSRCRPANSSRSRSRCTSRGTPTAQARASGSRSLRRTAPSPCGRLTRRSRKARPPKCRSRSGPACPPTSPSRSCPVSTCPRDCRPAQACATSPAAPTRRS